MQIIIISGVDSLQSDTARTHHFKSVRHLEGVIHLKNTTGISTKATADCCMAINMATPGTERPLKPMKGNPETGSFCGLKESVRMLQSILMAKKWAIMPADELHSP